MFNIQKYLEKFSENLKTTELDIEQIIEIIERETNIHLNKTEIEIKNNIIYTKTNPSVKNKIFIFKNKIIESLSKKLNIVDIK